MIFTSSFDARDEGRLGDWVEGGGKEEGEAKGKDCGRTD